MSRNPEKQSLEGTKYKGNRTINPYGSKRTNENGAYNQKGGIKGKSRKEKHNLLVRCRQSDPLLFVFLKRFKSPTFAHLSL